ncbi:MAG: PD-(D/E)XK nuclease family transposase, partial [Verrucomicrobia bacterium]|nr:PD-(D/E)XK nuclease family transposase [Verrucomicrobiota bacterium]
SHFDKWLYFLKHLSSMEDIPQILREPIFERGFALASLAAMSEDERGAYDHSLKVYWDLNSVVTTAKDEGRAQGLAQGRAEGRTEGLNEALQLLLATGMDEAVARKALNLMT